jgi:hypothetical protein
MFFGSSIGKTGGSKQPEGFKARLKAGIIEILIYGLIVTIATLITVLAMFFLKVKPVGAEAMHGDKPARGYFFYEDPVPEKKEEPIIEKAIEPPEEELKKEEKKEEFDFPVIAEAPEVLRTFLKEPNEENAKQFLAWQYQYIAHLKKIGYNIRNAYLRYGSEIYPIATYPENPVASVYYHKIKDDINKSVIEPLRDNLGLIYFYSKSCNGCLHQSEIVKMFIEKYGISVRGVSVDGDLDTSLPFESVYNPSLIEELKVSQIPTIIAILDKKDGSKPAIAGISVGFTALDMIEQTLIRFLIQEGVIQEKDLNPMFFTKNNE